MVLRFRVVDAPWLPAPSAHVAVFAVREANELELARSFAIFPRVATEISLGESQAGGGRKGRDQEDGYLVGHVWHD